MNNTFQQVIKHTFYEIIFNHKVIYVHVIINLH